MANTIGYGQGAVNNTNAWGQGAKVGSPSFSNLQSLEFDGVDDYVEVNYSTSLNITSAQTYSFWFKTTTATAMYAVTYGSGSQLKYAIQLYATSNRIRLYLWDGSGVAVTIDNTEVFNDGQWHHLAFTTDALTTTDGVKIYFDGTLLTNKGTLSNSGIRSITENLFIGLTPNSTSFRFNGNMDEISYFNSELSASDISTIYGTGAPSDISSISGLVSWWRFEGSGTTATDTGSGGNDGTLTNAGIDSTIPMYSTDVPT